MRIAISGTYGTGKSTLARVLAKKTGNPIVGARGMRDFLKEYFEEKPLRDCTPSDLIELGVRRFEERVATESAAGLSFISDGSSLNEWAYGLARRRYGVHLDRPWNSSIGHEMASFDTSLEILGRVFRDHASRSYDTVVHLPIEIPLNVDGHRPSNSEYRSYTDRLLAEAQGHIGIRTITVSGSIERRANLIISKLNL